MKIYIRSLPLVCAVAVLLTYTGCDRPAPPEPTIEEVQLGKLKSTWKVSAVTLDGLDKKTDYTNFQLTINGSLDATPFDYSTSGRPSLSPWPGSGKWNFDTDDPSKFIIRDPDNTNDEKRIEYTVSDTQLELTFDFDGAGYARTSNVKGEWVFTFTK